MNNNNFLTQRAIWRKHRLSPKRGDDVLPMGGRGRMTQGWREAGLTKCQSQFRVVRDTEKLRLSSALTSL